MILGLDPGPEESALLMWDGATVANAFYQPNEFILGRLMEHSRQWDDPLVIEKIASFGMPVGADVFETVYWSGRFAQAYDVRNVYRITRMEVKNHICHSSRAKDANIRQALIDRFGKTGNQKSQGPLYGVTGDLWSALAVAVTFWDRTHDITQPHDTVAEATLTGPRLESVSGETSNPTGPGTNREIPPATTLGPQ